MGEGGNGYGSRLVGVTSNKHFLDEITFAFWTHAALLGNVTIIYIHTYMKLHNNHSQERIMTSFFIPALKKKSCSLSTNACLQ